jgi:hypothetical protein
MESNGPFRPGNYPPLRSTVVQLMLLLAAVAAVFLAATERQGATGIYFLTAGALMVFLPPNRVLPWKYFLMGGGLVVLSALALLPKEFWPMPEWRVWLPGYPGIPELPNISVAPRETAYWMVVLFGAVTVGLFSLAHPVSANARVYLGLLGAAACAAYSATALYAKLTGWEYPFFDRGGFSPPEFGFFPNRNHTAAFLVTGSILSLGLIRDAWSNGRPFVFLASIGTMGVCVYGLLFHSISRAGVVFLLVGVLLWVAMLGRRHISIPLLVSSLVVGGLVVALFLGSDGTGRDRVLEMIGIRPQQEVGTVPEQPKLRLDTAVSDFRLRIFQDTFRMIGDYPLTGTGLGTYAYVYPFYAKASLGETAALHPESDWLMMVAECGIPFGILAVALLWMLVRDLWPLRESFNWPLRWGMASAALVAILHGVVDVPLHRVELGWWVLALAGLAFGCPLPTVRRDFAMISQRVILGLSGAAILSTGFLLIRAEWFGDTPFPPFRAAVVVDQMRQLAEAGKFSEATNLGRSEIPLSPMARGIYRELGFREIRNGGDPVVADTSFTGERALYPKSAVIPLDQGRLWLSTDPSRTKPLWVEALRRHVDIAANGGHPDIVTFYERLLGDSRAYPQIFDALGRESGISPELQLVWITRSSGDGLDKASRDPAFLKSLNLEGRRAFLRAWHAPANREKVDAFLMANPDWEEAAWSVRVRQMVADKRFEELVTALRDRNKLDLSLPTLAPEQLDSSQPPFELAEQVSWFFARGNSVSARRIVAEAVEAGQLEGLRVQCALAIQSGNWEAAWPALDKYLRETKRADYL